MHDVRVTLDGDTDFVGFRHHARALLAQGVEPGAVQWSTQAGGDLFALSAPGESSADVATLTPAPASAHAPTLTVPSGFLRLCETASLHADPQRFALLYRLLWRLQREPSLRADPLDTDILAARKMARAVSHEMHKMRAFLRFRQVPHPDRDGDTLHVAWFEPTHHVVDANAPWFMRRFTQMHWAILTPRRCVAWDGRALAFRAGARREDAPAPDAGEQLWLTYYASIFNPARLKLAMMEKEMPRRYWRNLPEAALISPLSAAAVARAGHMIEQPAQEPRRRIRPLARATTAIPIGIDTLEALNARVAACTACPLAASATQPVHGEGPKEPHLMFVGEQPGDREDLEGRPFVGPAGQLLERAFGEAGIERKEVFLTNAVRHFKYELRGRRRIHKTPGQLEAQACAQWLDHEISLVKPRAVVALGATAARALLHRQVAVLAERGEWQQRGDGLRVFVTLHPSSILRLPPHEQGDAFRQFAAELRAAAAHGW